MNYRGNFGWNDCIVRQRIKAPQNFRDIFVVGGHVWPRVDNDDHSMGLLACAVFDVKKDELGFYVEFFFDRHAGPRKVRSVFVRRGFMEKGGRF